MISIIPLEQYYTVYIHFTLFLVLMNVIHAYTLDLGDPKNVIFLKFSGIILLISVVLYLGLRPISRHFFGDMGTYAKYFTGYQNGLPVTSTKDVLFHYYMKFLSNFMTPNGFFLTTEFFYVIPMYLVSRKHFGNYWFYSFFMFLVSFSFYTYGVNGIRNGMATSMFLWGIAYHEKIYIKSFFFLLAVLFHKTLLLPILAYLLTYFYHDKPLIFFKIWLASIPFSLFLGSVFITVFTFLGFGDDRLTGYLTGSVEGINTSFRWDFLFYSSFPVFSGWYFIVKKHFNDIFYNKIYGTYLICNSFWILVIRANFSNRFAYLSWFMMAFVIIYPLLKKLFFEKQEIVIAKIVTAYFMFTYLMWLIYYG